MVGQENIVTNLQSIPGREILEIKGMVYGYVPVKRNDSGDRFVDSPVRKWPWAEDSKHYEMLMKEAEERMLGSAREAGADSVLGVEGRIQRGKDGDPEAIMMGTAVKTGGPKFRLVEEEKDRAGPGVEKNPEEGAEEIYQNESDEVAITIEDASATWHPVTAVPSEESKKGKRRPRGRGQKPGQLSPYTLANLLDISTERASILLSAGYGTIEDIAEADHESITAIEGINPTQARIMISKAREISENKKR